MAEIASSKIAKSDEVLKYYTSVLRGEVIETIETVVVTTSDSVHTVKKPPDLKTRISAGKELMKRYPDSNKLVDDQVRKLEAEADITEARAKDIENAQDGEESTIIVDDLERLMMAIKTIIKTSEIINPHFKLMWVTKCPYIIAKGGRGSFKSSTIGVIMMKCYIKYGHKVNVVCVRENTVNLRDSVYSQIRYA